MASTPTPTLDRFVSIFTDAVMRAYILHSRDAGITTANQADVDALRRETAVSVSRLLDEMADLGAGAVQPVFREYVNAEANAAALRALRHARPETLTASVGAYAQLFGGAR